MPDLPYNTAGTPNVIHKVAEPLRRYGPGVVSFNGVPLLSIYQSANEGRDNGSCLVIARCGVWRFRWAVTGGEETALAVWVRQPRLGDDRPQLKLDANPAIGLSAQVITAANTADWEQLQTSPFTPSVSGGAWVTVCNRHPGYSPLFVDRITAS